MHFAVAIQLSMINRCYKEIAIGICMCLRLLEKQNTKNKTALYQNALIKHITNRIRNTIVKVRAAFVQYLQLWMYLCGLNKMHIGFYFTM